MRKFWHITLPSAAKVKPEPCKDLYPRIIFSGKKEIKK